MAGRTVNPWLAWFGLVFHGTIGGVFVGGMIAGDLNLYAASAGAGLQVACFTYNAVQLARAGG